MNKFYQTFCRSFLSTIFLAFGATVVCAQDAPLNFAAESAIEKPAKIPAPIFAQLKRDRRARQCATARNPVKRSWFSAAIVDLNGDQVDDYVVKAENACLFGANLAPFWVFHNLTHRYSLVLRADALALEILPAATEDYRDIKLKRATAVETLENTVKFDGKKYR